MADAFLILKTNSAQSLRIPLHKTHHCTAKGLSVVTNGSVVYADRSYEFSLDYDTLEALVPLSLYINDELLTENVTKNVFVLDARRSEVTFPFRDHYGFVQLAVLFSKADDTNMQEMYVTDYISVLVKKSESQDAIKEMIDYIYSKQKLLLFSDELMEKQRAGLSEGGLQNLESRITMAGEIINTFELSFGFFKANARTKAISNERVSRIERMSAITNRTAQYISTHPEYLRRAVSSTGIMIGNRAYIPERTLTSQTILTIDIYENQVVMQFLKRMVDDITRMLTDVTRLLFNYESVGAVDNEYIHSSYFIYAPVIKKLQKNKSILELYNRRIADLYVQYRKILPVSLPKQESFPRPTATFMSVPQYKKIYSWLYRWNKYGLYDLASERFMLSFLKVSTLFECYTLAKILDYYQNAGYKEVNSYKFEYPETSWSKEVNCHNTYILENESKLITVYYQPVIYSADRRSHNGIGLFRNTSYSIRDSRKALPGGYYTPDILIKKVEKGVEHYYILDSKYSSLKSVYNNQIVPIAFKYIISISPMSGERIIEGVSLAYGRADSEEVTLSLYNYASDETRVTPRYYTIPLSPLQGEHLQAHNLKKGIAGMS